MRSNAIIITIVLILLPIMALASSCASESGALQGSLSGSGFTVEAGPCGPVYTTRVVTPFPPLEGHKQETTTRIFRDDCAIQTPPVTPPQPEPEPAPAPEK